MENEELNYPFILMRHIDRLSQVCTGYMVNPSSNMDKLNPQPVSDDALMYGVKFLDAITPRSLRDQEYMDFRKKLTDEFRKDYDEALNDGSQDVASVLRSLRRSYDFNCLKVSINLLDRKGLLLPHKVQSTAPRPKGKGKDKDLVEVWEDADS